MRRRALSVPVLIAAALVAIAIRPSDARAQEHAELVWKQLMTAFNSVSERGFSTRNYIVGRMDDDATDSWTLTFEKGVTYQIIGVCDEDCSDLDIEIIDGDTVIEKDLLDDDAPIVSFTPKGTSPLRVKVTMAACSEEPCFFGFGIFQKR